MGISADGQSAAFAAPGSHVIIEGQTPNTLWWHSLYESWFRDEWPVCWPKNGPMALWFNRDGWISLYLETCVQFLSKRWKWAWTQTAPNGAQAVVTNEVQEIDGNYETVHNGTGLDMFDAFDAPANSNTYVYLDGVGYVLVLSTASHHIGNTTIPEGYENPNQPHPGSHASNWCGWNPGEPFLLPPGTNIQNVPAPQGEYDENDYWVGTQCYIPHLMCSRLFLVQNAVFNADNTIDFSDARVKMLGHGDTRGSHVSGWDKLKGKNRKNGVRPIHYKRGAGGFRAIENHAVCGELDMDGFFFPPIENAADPLARSKDPDPTKTKSPVFAPFVHRGGICHPDSAPTYLEGTDKNGDEIIFRADWPNKWPSYIFASVGYENKTKVFKHHARFWEAKPGAPNADMLKVRDAFSMTGRAVEIWGEVPPEEGEEEAAPRYERPFPSGTAFDMVVAVRTWYWNRYIGMEKKTSGEHQSASGATYLNDRYEWVKSGRGYMNSQVAGYLYQLSATKPKQQESIQEGA